MLARIIKKEHISLIINEPWVDHTRRIYTEKEIAYIPVISGYDYDTSLPERKPYSGRGYQKIGDQILIHGPKPGTQELKELILWEKPKAVLCFYPNH